MSVLVILGHPDPRSFNGAIAQTVVSTLGANGYEVIFHDLYGEGFDPILPAEEIASDAPLDAVLETHCQELVQAQGIVMVHPNWWGQPPAMLKGWVDRVIRPGVAYEFVEGDDGEGVPSGLLKAKAALVFNTANTPARREQEAFGDPLHRLWRDCIFELCGVSAFERRMFEVVVLSDDEQRGLWLKEVREIVSKHFPPLPT